ncbi:uncharacterized protein B0P05DRAFT_478878 [Gilbertella persicaria]|uniref:uncharacterized protein n=1 Tax=Gilbertella persicaria TaxID=101096 RepID=UPI00221E8E64|nr:uncharacterized protein B0P05DRAFT_478878 [Gilbertella persicaria]KAI8057531.1 hypothetical protein B0P05DRAFT_478878 [Gilbertella persicaria]
MGNSHSDIKSTFSSKHVPEHLKPIKKKKHRRPRSVNYIVEEDENELKKQKALQKPVIMDIPTVVIDNVDEEDLAEGEASLVGSGPRGAFRWFKGRRYINHHEKVLDKNLLPNDQLELDRLRVLSFIIRWAFRSNIVAPIEEDLQKGMHVLNVG